MNAGRKSGPLAASPGVPKQYYQTGARVAKYVQTRPPGTTLSLPRRWALAAAAVFLLALLATAAWLTPSPAGHGTHQQLGFSECFFVSQWGVRCPSCGMTTAWARLLNGDLRGGVAANAAGVLLALLAIITAPWLLVSAISGQWWYCRPQASLVLTLLAAVALVALFDWYCHTGHVLADWTRIERILSGESL